MNRMTWTSLIGMATLLGFSQGALAATQLIFDTTTATEPFRVAVVNNSTSFSGTVTDPTYNGGTDVTFSFSDPLTGVNITTPSSPVFTGATASFFGAEGTGMGVGNSGLGRFERGEAFTMSANHAFSLNSFVFHEWNGDEQLHISWVRYGTPQSAVFDMTQTGGTAPSTVIVALSGILVDADTDLTITNVGPNTNNAGRLRFRRMNIELIPEPGTVALLGAGTLLILPLRKRVR